VSRFAEYCGRREREALDARIPGYTTVSAAPDRDMVALGNDWSRYLFDGAFYRSAHGADAEWPLVNLVFVESRTGNTVAANPSLLGGGQTDKHLVYEGLSRVDADAVLSGATTARARNLVFSVWHPELVALRRALGHDRHPAQVIVTSRGRLPLDDGLMFVEPSLRTFLVAPTSTAVALRDRLRARPWIQVIDGGEPLSFRNALRELRQSGLRVISAVGGARTATSLLKGGLVRDLYLTTSAIDAGQPNTPFYERPPLPMRRVIEKAGRGEEAGVRFEHFVIGSG
jgi:riboflavin biosynthesis pyrimidine reductase